MPQDIETTGESREFGAGEAAADGGTVGGPDNLLKSVTDRIGQAVKLGGGYSAVAARGALAGRTLSNLVAGQEPKYSQLLAIAEATGVRLEWLTLGTGPVHSSEAGLMQCGDEMAGDDLVLLPAGSVLIPRYDARASAGPGVTLDAGVIVDKVPFAASFLAATLRRNPSHLALIECVGDSMEPTLHDGDLLMVDTSVREVGAAQIYILSIAGALLAKRLQRRMDGSVLILSDNPRYPPEQLTPSPATPLHVVGEVVWRSGTQIG